MIEGQARENEKRVDGDHLEGLEAGCEGSECRDNPFGIEFGYE